VALEAFKAHKTAAQIAQMFEGSIRPTSEAGRNRRWRGCPTSSAKAADQIRQKSDQEKDKLCKQIAN
jgi:hypothetical protein